MPPSASVQGLSSRLAASTSGIDPVTPDLEANMFSKKTIAAGIVALGALAASAPANADSLRFSVEVGRPIVVHDDQRGYGSHDHRGYGWDDHRSHQKALSASEVRRILRHRGYRDISYLDRRGSIYQVRARDYRGRRVGLVVSARNGAILTAYRLG
jgi:hypothetical protein